MREGWNETHPDDVFDSHQVLVTVPASFDEVARELTLKAAEQAGYRDVILLEEPQAAFYAWIERNSNWREQVGVGDLVLVIDIGGGTTDFTLIAVKEQAGEIALERIAVGDHILLGGDNIDAALAHSVAQALLKNWTRSIRCAVAAMPERERTTAGAEDARAMGDRSARSWAVGPVWWVGPSRPNSSVTTCSGFCWTGFCRWCLWMRCQKASTRH